MSVKRAITENTDYHRLVRENQRMVALLEMALMFIEDDTPLIKDSAFHKAIQMTVNQVNNPMISVDSEGLYTNAIKLRGRKEISNGDFSFIISTNIPDGEIWLSEESAKLMADHFKLVKKEENDG